MNLRKLNAKCGAEGKQGWTLTFSGVGTNCKGYQGHLDADWRDQVKEGLAD